MTAITVNTANGPRTLTAAATKQWYRWLAVNSGNTSGCATISTDHPMMRHSPNPLRWSHPAALNGTCKTWGELYDHQGQSPSPDHYFVGVNP